MTTVAPRRGARTSVIRSTAFNADSRVSQARSTYGTGSAPASGVPRAAAAPSSGRAADLGRGAKTRDSMHQAQAVGRVEWQRRSESFSGEPPVPDVRSDNRLARIVARRPGAESGDGQHVGNHCQGDKAASQKPIEREFNSNTFNPSYSIILSRKIGLLSTDASACLGVGPNRQLDFFTVPSLTADAPVVTTQPLFYRFEM